MGIAELEVIPTDAVLGLRCPRCGAELQGTRESATEVHPRTFPAHFHVRYTAECRGCGITYRARIKAYTDALLAAGVPSPARKGLGAQLQPALLEVQRPAA